MELLEMAYIDVCELMTTQIRGGYSYVITFMDDMS